MRLTALRVENLRSIRDSTEFAIAPMFALVGENNTGKSNILRAIEVLLSAGAARLDRSDFFDPVKPIVIKGVFGDLTAQEKVRWKPYLIGEALTLEKHVAITLDERTSREKIEGVFHGYQAEPKAWYLSPRKIQETLGDRPKWADIVKEGALPDYFLDGGKATKASYTKALAKYLAENDVEFDAPDLSQTHALGFQSNVVAALPRVYLLPAITDYSSEIDKRSSSSTFRRLMAALSERLIQTDPRFGELQNAIASIRSLLNKAEFQEGAPRIESLAVVERKVTELLQQVMPSVQAVELSVQVDEIKDLFAAGVSISVDDGVSTDVLAKGHGLQRCIVFTLLQTLILNERNQLLRAAPTALADGGSILLLVEEPELYIHPQLAKLFFDVLVTFADTDQVVYTTHSPVFVDAYEAERVALISKPSVASGTAVRGCDKTAFDGLDDRKLFQGFTRLNSSMNELFFAKRVLLVEGPEDAIAVTATLKNLGRITARVEELEWSIIATGGKASIPFFQRVLNAFSIPYSVLHDLDLVPGMDRNDEAIHRKQNEAIAQLSRGQAVHSYPVKLEASLGLRKHFPDQYSAHVYFSDETKITQEVKDIVARVFA